MPHKNLSLIFFLLLITLCVAPTLAQESSSVVVIAPGEPILIGVSVGLGEDGNVTLGNDALRGIQIAQEELPDLQFDDTTFPLELDVQDTACSTEGGAATAEYFSADDRVVGILGPVCTASCLGAAPIYDATSFSFVSPGCTSSIFQQRAFASFNHTQPVNSGQAIAAAFFYYETLGIRRVAIIRENNDYATSISHTMDHAFTALGGEILGYWAITAGLEDYGLELTSVAATEPEALYLAVYTEEAARIVAQRADTGLDDIPIFGTSAWFSPAVPEYAGAVADQNVYLASNLPAEMTEERRARQAAFAARYEERFGEAPVSHVHDNAYDTYLMLRAAIEQVGTLDDEGNLRIDRAALAAALRTYGPVDGLSGPSLAMAAANVPPPPSASGRYRMAPSRSSRRWLTPAWLSSNECNSSPLRYTGHKRPIQTAGHLPRQGGNHEMDA